MHSSKTKYIQYVVGILSVLILTVFDQYTKNLAVIHLKNQKPIDIWNNVFQLHYLENRGAAFGMLEGKKVFFILSGIIILCTVCYFYGKMPVSKKYNPLRICMILIVAGAIGNMVDRVAKEYVVDFLYFELIDFPIFNVADIYVTVAACVLIILLLCYYKEDELFFLTFKKI